MNCWTRFLALGVFAVGAIGEGAAIAAVGSTLSPSSPGRDPHNFELAAGEVNGGTFGCARIDFDNTLMYERPSASSEPIFRLDKGDIAEIIRDRVFDERTFPSTQNWVEVRYVALNVGERRGFVPVSSIGARLNCPPLTGGANVPTDSQCYAVAETTVDARWDRDITLAPVRRFQRGEFLFLTNPTVSDASNRQWKKIAESDFWVEYRAPRSSAPAFFPVDNANCRNTTINNPLRF